MEIFFNVIKCYKAFRKSGQVHNNIQLDSFSIGEVRNLVDFYKDGNIKLVDMGDILPKTIDHN